ncbi:hypothetical protein GKZ89_14175 [Bacillus mangrovi]|uniref:LXG domain-containing protein n=1 Tax=Metabacillus mangrovi TaxID=1491830 RepID=A0A7X2S6Y5_9BACI|nr:T7SS effector LXG polymorphic toxin [Metabacillus mangrovi]MTH54547.1 hypothetical protein [Metabacillus mangrovi]
MPRTYDSEALLLATNKRKEQYTQLVSQLQSLNKKYMAIIQDEEFQGKGADAIKNFYTEHTILIGKWIGFCYMQIAFINSIPGEITDHNLSEKTFIREEFVEGEVRDGIEKSREMVVDQKETLDKILSGIKDILPLEVFSSEAFETNMRKTSKRATKSVQNMHKADIALTEDYGTSKMNQQFIKQYYTELNQATNGSKNVNQIMFSTEDFRKREFYKDIEAVDENAVEYVKEKNEELRVRRVEELKKKLENYHKLSQAEFLEIGKEIGYDELTSEQQAVYRAYVNAKNKADFGRGVTQGISETASEALDSVLNLGESAQGLGQAIKDPMGTLNIMVDDVKTSYTRDVLEGDTVSRSRWFTSEFLSIIGTKGIGSAAKKSLEASKIGDKVSDGADAVKRKMPFLEDIPYNAMSPAGLSSSFRVNSINDIKSNKNFDKNKTTGLRISPHLIKKYVKDVEMRTNRKIPKSQIEELKEALRNKEYEKLSPVETRKNRRDFNKVKNKLIVEWEEKTNQKWPTYKEDVISKTTGEPLRRKGDKYDAHHIIENSYGGEHEWWNIHPAKYPSEHQSGIHGSGSPANELFKGGKKQ